ncbi:MAG: ketoacyl-ACP synthase III [Flavobacteriia bacterium]|nr:ketoacyl-ACP synthase III [Flavobacteriia bacterium]
MYVKFTGTGHVLPSQRVTNEDFINHEFYDEKGERYPMPMADLLKKFEEITGIGERRYANDKERSSDLGAAAGKVAIEEAGIDPNSIDLIIAAHNFGDIDKGTGRSDILPSLASRIKHLLEIDNERCVPFDILFGCPGWIQGVLLAEMYIKAGKAKRALVVGCEMLSRTLDPHDRNGMIFADGAGACILEASDEPGIIGSAVMNKAAEEAYYLFAGPGEKPGADPDERYIKMRGRKIYEFALKEVPKAMKLAMDDAGVEAKDLDMIFMHQANAKLDHAVVDRFYRLYGIKEIPVNVLPMSVNWLGNSSVATVPTLFDLVRKTEYNGHTLKKGDTLLFASVGAGMNVNAFVYKY